MITMTNTIATTLAATSMVSVVEKTDGQSGMVSIVGAAQTGMVALVGNPGLPGVPGPAANLVQHPAAVALGGHRMVVLDDAAQAIYADKGTPSHATKVLGITTGAAAQGDTATIQTGGEITEPSWAWALNQPIYLGTNGLLTQAAPAAGFSLIVGFPLTETKIFVAIGQPITLL